MRFALVFPWLFACSTPADVVACPDLPAAATAPPTVLGNSDDCGRWIVAVGEQLVVSVVVTEPEATCEMETDAGLTLLYDPIYTAMSNDEPKWTFQVKADAEVDGAWISVTCEDGTTWSAVVDVAAAE